jgi:hypothetical protein
VNHLAGCQKLSLIVAAVDTRDEAVDASPDVNGIVHDLPVMMTPDRRRGARVARGKGAEKAGKGRRDNFGLSAAARILAWNPLRCRPFLDGETRTRTGDTTIFSRVLYQLSYLASAREG